MLLLRDDTTPDYLRPLVLSCLSTRTSGRPNASTEARRTAAARAGGLDLVMDAMRRFPDSCAMQQFGAEAVHTICATDEHGSVGAWRADAAVRAGAHVLIIDAMARHSSDKMGSHEMAAPHEEKGNMLLVTGSSILQTSIRALCCLASNDCSGQRPKALNAAGALKVVANAVRLNPPIADSAAGGFTHASGKKLEDDESIPKFLANLVGAGGDLSALVLDKADYALLFKDIEVGKPRVFARAMRKGMPAVWSPC